MSALRPMELLRVDPASAGAKLQLAVSPATGSAEVRIPIPLTAGRDGFGPTLALAFGGYDPLSPFAHGWSLAGLPSIDVDTRDGLPAYDGAERFRYAGQELVPLDDASRPTSWTREGHEVRVFRARLEAVPIRAERWTHQTTRRVHWRVRTGGGAVQVFGRREDAESRLADPADPRRTFRWLLESAFDRLGNAMLVRHAIEDDVGVDPLGLDAHRFASATANRYPKRILYGNAAPLAESDDTGAATWHFETVFDYGDHDTALPATTPSGPWPARQDSSFAGHLGFEIRTRRLCRRVLMFHRFPAELGEAETLVGSLELDHAEAPDASVLTRVRYVGWRTEGEARVSQATPWASVAYTDAGAEDGFRIVQAPLLARETRFVDLFGEGVAGLLTLKDGAAYYARNLGEGTFGAHEALPEWPLGLASGRLADLDRDGNLELFQPTGPLAGYYRFDRRERRWEPLRCYKGALNLAPDTGVLFLADMTGDGRSSVVLLHATGLTWFPSEGPEGLGDPVDVALPASKLPVASHATARFMADMTGDGLADLVEVQNGSVRYWPNLGRGRFGDPVEMDAAPRLDSQGAYDPARVLFVDLDQTGASDLVYLRADGAVLRASNRRGVSFGPLETIALGAAVPDLARIDLADVYGDGSRCLVVFAPSGAGSAALHVLRLTSAPGARQVRSVTHSLGAVTEIEWGHSVRHYLRDEAAGRGWDTPLPTHHAVVDALHHVEPIDGASARERLRYHDGHYDPRARSFGTFAVVDRLDVDTEGDVGEVVPLLTRSFWHTGEPDHASRFARHEYSGDPEALPAPACSVQAPPAPLARDLDEAFGALVGSPVREELYATDAGGTPASHPLRVITNSRAVSVVRASDDTYRTGVQIVPSDSQTSEYEQTPSDPRVSVQRQLAFDAYLTPVLAVQAGLPRREGGSHPFEAQARVVATAARSVAAHVDTEARFELGILVEGRTYELHAPTADAILAPNLESNIAIILDAASAYDEPLDPEGTELAARELTHQRAYYWDDTQTAALPLGSVGAIVLPHHSEDAAYDRGQLASVFGARVDPDVDLAPLGYVEDGDVFYRVGPTHRYTAAAGFHRLVEVEIYDGGVQRITPDAHHLTTVEAVDPVGNAVQAQIDYHVLAPYRLTDPNGTVQEIDYDPLGVQRRTSRYGTALDALGNVVDHGFGPLVPGEARPAFAAALADPEAALGGAESLLLYEHGSGGAPTQVMTLLAEELVHRGPDAATSPARARVSIAYLDGFGRAIQTRTRVEPGVAWTLDPGTGELVEAPVTTRWRVSGHVVLDAKQLPRAQYEPFFRDDHAFEAALARRQVGVATTTTYDALGRVTQRALPNGTLSRTTYRPWRQESSDPNDSVGLATEYVAARAGLAASDPERIALTQALENEGTPVSVHRDPLGRDIALVEVVEDDAELVERASLEVRGLSVATIDRRATVASTRQFDRLGRGLLESSMDAGSVRVLFDAADREVKRWREDTEERRVFDVAGRLLERHVTDGSTSWLAERITYGEGVAGAADRNQLGRVVLVEDGAGTLATTRYGAFGEPLASERTLVAAAGSDPDWSGSVPLEAVSYQGRAAFDALGRRTRALLPDGTERRHEYLRSGPASKLEVVTPDATVRTILVTAEYNARGQQTRVELGNGVEVSSDYDAQTFRLFRRRAVLGTDTYQDLRHHYDPVGNLVYVDDLAQRPDATHVINGLLVTAERVFRYDARYQLTEATGRAHNALTRADFRGDVPNAGSFRGTRRVGLNDGGAVARYRRTYAYDAGGNLLGWQHGPEGAGPGSTWSHEKWVSSTSNRSYLAYDLNGIAISDPQSKFDARGQITSLPNVQAMQWSPRDQLRRVVLIERTGDPDDAELYDYAADGSRLRKTTQRLVSGNLETTETVYFGECELKRITQGSTVVLERWSSHVEDGDARLATLYRWPSDPFARETENTSVVRTHYHLGTHLGSVALELGAAGEVLAYEEYFPYGGTAFLAGDAVIDIAFRTRRFVGKDQDDATGFCVFQFRYYAPFLGTWVSPDPAGEIDGPNRYWYARNNPATVTDPLGLAGELMTGPMFTDEAAALRYYNRTYARFQMRVITDLSPYQENGANVPGRWVIASERAMTEEEWQATLEDWRAPARDLILGPPDVGPTAPPSVGESEEPAGAGDTGGELSDGPVAPHVERALDELGDELGQMEGNDDPLAGLPGIPVASGGADSADSTGRETPSSDGGTPAPASIPAAGSAEPGAGTGDVGTGTGTSGVGTGAGGEGTGIGAGGASAGRSSTSGSAGGSPGSGRGRGAGAGHDRRRARSTPASQARAGRRSRDARAGGAGGTTQRDRPRGTSPSANGNATVPGGTATAGSGMPSGVAGGAGATPSPSPDASTGNQPGTGPRTPGGGSPMSGIAGSEVGSATGLNPNAGMEGGSTGALQGGSPTGSQFGTRSGQDDGSVLSGAETGEGAATTTDRVIAAAGILAGNTVGYNPNDPAATEDGAGGVFGWIDLGPLNAPFWLIAAIGLAITGVRRGFQEAAELAGEVTRRGAGLLESALGWVGRRLSGAWDEATAAASRGIGRARRMSPPAAPTEAHIAAARARIVDLLEAGDDLSRQLATEIRANVTTLHFEDLGPLVNGAYRWTDDPTGIILHSEFAMNPSLGAEAAVATVHEAFHMDYRLALESGTARPLSGIMEELRAFSREADFAEAIGRRDASTFARIRATEGLVRAVDEIKFAYRDYF